MRRSWLVPGGQAYVVYPGLGEDVVQHDDGTWSPTEFTYVELPDDRSLPYFVVECAYAISDLVPRITAVHVISRDGQRRSDPLIYDRFDSTT